MIKRIISLFILLFFQIQNAAASFSYMGCYANTGVSLGFKNTYPSNPLDQCSSICQQSKYLGIIEGNKCYCGDSSPLSNSVSDANCNSNCTGSSGNCGGSSYYALYQNKDVQSSSLSSYPSSSSSDPSSSLWSSLSSNSVSDWLSVSTLASSSLDSSSGTITVSPSSSASFVSATANNSSWITSSFWSSSSFSSDSSSSSSSSFPYNYTTSSSSLSSSRYSHSHRSASTSSESVITTDSEFVRDGITITSAVLKTLMGSDVELTQTADDTISSSVTVVNNKSQSIKSQVAGGVVGGTAGISMICFLVWYYTRRVKQKDEEEKQRNLATIAATMVSKNAGDLSYSGTVHGSNHGSSPFNDQYRKNTLGSKPSTKRRLDGLSSPDGEDSFQFYDNNQHLIRMGSTGHESIANFMPMRMGSTGHDDEHQSFNNSTLGSFSSATSDGYYAQKMAEAEAEAAATVEAAALNRNTSSATNRSATASDRYSFASFESRKIIVDDEIASSVERDDGSVHGYEGPSPFGLTIANPDNDSDSDSDNEDYHEKKDDNAFENNDHSQNDRDDNNGSGEDGRKLRVLF